MHVKQLITPSFLVDLDILEENIRDMALLCRLEGKELWPMIKTHKSSAIAKLQQQAGAAGFLTSTLDEAEGLVNSGISEIMLAYPVAGKENISKMIKMTDRANIILSLDGSDAAEQLNERLKATHKILDYLIIIDCGLHRFGVAPDQAVDLAYRLQDLACLQLRGIATHPGHVYGAASFVEVAAIAAEEAVAMQTARESLQNAGFNVGMVATGSTPTVRQIISTTEITAVRPGNYVFYDHIQVALGTVTEVRCAFTVLATILSRPQADVLIIDAGSKCLGLDKGAHGNALLKGFGLVKGHAELLITALSEEVGKIKICGPTSLNVGDKLQIIPNHACSAANMTDYLIGHRKEIIEAILDVDMRGGTRQKPAI